MDKTIKYKEYSLYKRAGSNNWYCRFSIRGHQYRICVDTRSKVTAKKRAEELKKNGFIIYQPEGTQIWHSIVLSKVRQFRISLETNDYKVALNHVLEVKERLFVPIDGKTGMFFKEAVEKFLEYSARNKKSFQVDLSRAKTLLSFFGEKKITGITLLDIESFRNGLIEKGYEKSTINRFISLGKTVVNKMIEWEMWEGKNPFDKVKKYKENTLKIFFSVDELRRILDYAFDLSNNAKTLSQFYFYPFCLLSICIGARAGEILNLTWDDIKEDYVIFRESKTVEGRVVPIPEICINVLRTLKGVSPDGYVIGTIQRKVDTFRKIWKKMKREINLSEGTPHTFRHTFSTLNSEDGINLIILSTILGHLDVRTTQNYSHPNLPMMRTPIEKFSTKIAQGVKTNFIPKNIHLLKLALSRKRGEN